jgi:hypothetical protein
VHLAIIVGLGLYIVQAAPPWYIAAGCAVVAGHSWACLAFLAVPGVLCDGSVPPQR